MLLTVSRETDRVATTLLIIGRCRVSKMSIEITHGQKRLLKSGVDGLLKLSYGYYRIRELLLTGNKLVTSLMEAEFFGGEMSAKAFEKGWFQVGKNKQKKKFSGKRRYTMA